MSLALTTFDDLAKERQRTNGKNETSHRLGGRWTVAFVAGMFSTLGGAAGEPPPGSEKPDWYFLQAQFRFWLERVSFSGQESAAQQ
ncbi:MAG: hypothetical protein M3O36_15100, partial [Myxococcota bacterium]|nr:hypothetical protein [Myxococcota bacterium]